MKTRVDWFLADILNIQIEVKDEDREALVQQAEAWLKATGQVPWDRWAMLGDESRKILVEAGERVRLEAAQATVYFAKMYKPDDAPQPETVKE